MKHARADYDAIQDPRGLIPENEPVFLLRAQDEFAPHCLQDYAARCSERGLEDLAKSVRRHAGLMFEWQQHRAKKLPTVPGLSEDATEAGYATVNDAVGIGAFLDDKKATLDSFTLPSGVKVTPKKP